MANRLLRGIILAVLAVGCASGTGAQQPPPATSPALPPTDPGLYAYLSETPVTLLEWGMLRLGRDVQNAVTALSLDGGRGGPVRAGTLLRPFDRRVLAYVSLPFPGKSRSLDQCQEVYTMLRENLLAGAPSGMSGPPWYLQKLFGADTRYGRPRPEPYGEKLVEMVLLEVTLRVPEAEAFSNGGQANVTCAGRFDQEKAALVPPWKPPAG